MKEWDRLIRGLDADGVRPIVVASYPRSGTHLLMDALRLNFRECRTWKRPGEPLQHLYLDLDSLTDPKRPLPLKTAGKLLRRAERPIIKTHAAPGFKSCVLAEDHNPVPEPMVDWLQRRADVVHVCRHVCASMCSLHQFARAFDLRAKAPIQEYIRQQSGGVSRVRGWAHHVQAWLNQTDAFTVRMEDLLGAPPSTLLALGNGLGLRARADEVRLPTQPRNLWWRRLSRIVGIRPTSTAMLGDRQGRRPLDPRYAFGPAELAFIRSESGDVLRRLNYKDEYPWVDAPPVPPDALAEFSAALRFRSVGQDSVGK
jgi:hypothetical protein